MQAPARSPTLLEEQAPPSNRPMPVSIGPRPRSPGGSGCSESCLKFTAVIEPSVPSLLYLGLPGPFPGLDIFFTSRGLPVSCCMFVITQTSPTAIAVIRINRKG